jgi:small subunit ribosomal protein S8
MSNCYNLANLFSHIKNAQKSRILIIEHPQSKLILSVLSIFQECGYIRGYRVIDFHKDPFNNKTNVYNFENEIKKHNYPKIEILLKYKNQKPAINNIICISKPSKKVYLSIKQLSHILTKKTSKSNLLTFTWDNHLSSLLFMKGILILTTSKGIMTHLTAYRLNIGGQVLCHIS